jgi:hypothetical protein
MVNEINQEHQYRMNLEGLLEQAGIDHLWKWLLRLRLIKNVNFDNEGDELNNKDVEKQATVTNVK